MRIESLALERFGAFTDRVLPFRPDAALHVVLGANEAGKTSALAAIADLLFGFGHLTPYDFAHDTRALRIGGTFRLADGKALAVRRRKGTKNTLVDANDQPLAEDLLAPMLGGVTRETFRTEFGLTAQALREGGLELLKAGGRLAETLAASSAGLTALARLRDGLNGEADGLFTPRRSSGKAFYVAVDRHDTAERRLREAVVTADALEGAEAAVKVAKARQDALNAEHAEAGRTLARLTRTLRTRPKLVRLESLAAEIAALADLPVVPAQTVAGWRNALTADTLLADQLGRLAAADAADAASVAALAVDEAVLAAGGAIDALRERIGAVRKAVDDLPRRREARRAAQDALDDAARRLGLPSHEALRERLPSDPALARVRDLVAAGKREAERHREALLLRDRAVEERARLEAEAGGTPEASDPEPFRHRLEALAEVPADADRLRRDRAAFDLEERSLAEAAAALDPAAGTPDALAALKLPDEAAIAAQAGIAADAAEALRQARSALATAERAVGTAEAQITELSRDSVGATPADLEAARVARNAALDGLDAALGGAPAERTARLATVRALTREVDDITDRLLANAERAALRQAAEERRGEAVAERGRATAALAGVAARRTEAAFAWDALWAASGIVPGPPGEMVRWRERVSGILDRRRRLAERQAEAAALASGLDSAAAALAGLLADHGRTPEAGMPAELLHHEARSRLVALQAVWIEARARDVARRRAARDEAEAEAALARAEAAVAAHAGAWPAAVAAIGLAPGAFLAEAEAALGVWQSVGVPRQSFEREGRSVEGIERDLAAFDADVAAVAARAAPDLAGRPARDALDQLSARLAEARRAAEARAGLRRGTAERGATRADLALRQEAVAAVVADARLALGLAEAAPLAPLLDRLEQRQALEAERSVLARDLADIADGLDEAALRAEQAGLDPDLLSGEIQRLGPRQGQILGEIGEASAALHQARREHEALAAGRDAGRFALERAEAAAELLSIAERWVVRAAAARLATRAIERHREAAQDPLVQRAGELFRVATAEAFGGLGADYDDADRPVLMARRADGSRVPVAGLSEGTRDQLFLALRLALLERRAAEPLPFIGDDLLASFDEARAARTLALLAEFGRARQVILFTHHRHVADLAASAAGPSADLIEL